MEMEIKIEFNYLKVTTVNHIISVVFTVQTVQHKHKTSIIVSLSELKTLPKEFLVELFTNKYFISALSDLKNGMYTTASLLAPGVSREQYNDIYKKFCEAFDDEKDLRLLLEVM